MSDNPDSGDYVPNLVIPEGEGLPRNTRQLAVINDIPNAIAAGLGPTAAYNAYLEAGVGIQKQAFLNAYRDIQAQIADGNLPLITDVNAPFPDVDRAILERDSKNRYLDVVSLAIYDTSANETYTRLHYMYHDSVMSVSELMASAMDFYNETEQGQAYQLVVMSASSFRGFIARNKR